MRAANASNASSGDRGYASWPRRARRFAGAMRERLARANRRSRIAPPPTDRRSISDQ
ncbi:hypothetical protein BTH_I2108 [Burkholderia thailandensis E264]|uniref:Uncharacterized protein n=1 Tax=Burkholderia thailandensis (strain ATCC 700388 / DSM 13276 / CCUG 48851 / CIP 106301 / E264) TaxID=271848 RepID=Q2SWR8_BURTA|nr:hypothetical protein BTH_I2108 [Burkholderia thailandensis E264]